MSGATLIVDAATARVGLVIGPRPFDGLGRSLASGRGLAFTVAGRTVEVSHLALPCDAETGLPLTSQARFA